MSKQQRKHKNTTRLTARERAYAVANWAAPFVSDDDFDELRRRIQSAIAAAVRQALRRNDRRGR